LWQWALAENHPGTANGGDRSQKVDTMGEHNSQDDEECRNRKTENEKSMRGRVGGNRRLEANSNATSKCHGNRYCRKFHGARLRRTSVSM
jgi:hypothetical protein